MLQKLEFFVDSFGFLVCLLIIVSGEKFSYNYPGLGGTSKGNFTNKCLK
jgi:hypothetical protein